MRLWRFLKKYLLRKDLFYKIREQIRLFKRNNFKTIEGDLSEIFGNKVNIIFDIGAHHGNTVDTYSKCFPSSTIYAFEPYPDSFNIITKRFRSNRSVIPIPAAMGDKTGEAFLNISEWTNLNSMQLPNERAWGFSETKRISVKIDTLDHFMEENQIQHIDILKLDVQGFEKQVLLGAPRVLSRQAIDAIVVEFQIIPLYQGHTLYFEIAGIMKQYGYDLFNWYEVNEARSGQIRWCDAIFLSQKLNQKLLKRYGKGVGSGW